MATIRKRDGKFQAQVRLLCSTKTFASLSWAPLFKRVTDQLLVLLFLLDPGFLHSHGHVLQMRT